MDCPLCQKNDSRSFQARSQEAGGGKIMPLRKCRFCGLIFSEDYAADRSLIYGENYATWGEDLKDHAASISKEKRNSFRHQLKHLEKFVEPDGKKILDVGIGGGFLLKEARSLGFDCYGLDVSSSACAEAKKYFGEKIFCGALSEADYPDSFFDVIFMTDVLEHLKNPVETLREANRILKPAGLLFVISPNTSSISHKLFRKNWFQYKYEHVFYFNKKSFAFLLEKSGFDMRLYRSNIKRMSLEYCEHYFKKYGVRGLSFLFRSIFPLLPKKMRGLSFPNPMTGEFLAIAVKKTA